MPKKILIVTGSDYTDRVYEAFLQSKTLGHELYLLSDGSFVPRAGIFEQHFTYDLRKTKEVLNFMQEQKLKFDAVTIKTSEWLTPLVALLAKQFGCLGNTPLTAFNCRSKYHMRQVLEKAQVPIPKFQLCKNYQDLKQAIDKIGIPCVAKPVGGNASYGTFIIRRPENLENLEQLYQESIKYLQQKAITEDVFAFSNEEMQMIGIKEPVDMVTDYLVEEYMAGPEVSIDALVQDGEVTIFGIEDQIRMAPPYVLQLAARLPYVCNEERQAEIYELVCHTIQAMGIKNSATHTEIIFTPQGAKIVEIGCRIGGDDLHDTIYQVTGYNLMFESIMIALGIRRTYKVSPKCHTMMQFIFPSKAGEIAEITIPQKVLHDPDIYEVSILAKVGELVGCPPQDFDYLGYIAAKGSTPAAAQAKIEEALQKIKISIK